jgi:3',5'-cyclic AMP phosphodiesterase CpdA
MWMKANWTRRALLRSGSLALAGFAVGCNGPIVGLGKKNKDQNKDTADTGVSLADATLSKQMYVQVTGPASVRLRFETREEVPVVIVITDPDGVETVVEAETSAQYLVYDDYFIPDTGEGSEGTEHLLHSIALTELVQGGRYHWTLTLENGLVSTGSFRAPPKPSDSFRFGWIADTLFDNTTAPIERLAAARPDVVVHGGDLVYSAYRYESWVAFSQAIAPITALSPMMTLVGNHEYARQNEIEEMFDRLYAGQGDSHGTRYFAFTYGNMRFIGLDTESDRQGMAESVSEQDAWLEEELAAAAADPDIKVIAVGMHRPMYTLSFYWETNATLRDARHALFVQYGVSLVFCGHTHAYERFLVDGITYIVDGGGGGSLYDPTSSSASVEASRPGESALQISASKSHGCTVVEIAGDGTWSLERYDATEDILVDSANGS